MKTITQLFFIIVCSTVGFSQTVAYLDFGSSDTTTEDLNYNNIVTQGEEDASFVATLIDSTGADTGITLTLDDAFHGTNTVGAATTAEGVIFPTSATTDSFYGEAVAFNGVTQPTGGFTLTGLDPLSFYSFEIFASRTNVTDGKSRLTLYTVQGLTTSDATLETANNTSDVAEIANIQPAADGSITFTAEPAPGNTNANKFYYLGAIRMEASTVLSTESAVLSNSLAVYPNPVSSRAQITFDLKEQSNLKINVYDLSGRLVENIVNGEQPAGKFSTTWDRSSNIASGVYILQIDANGKRSNSKLLLK